MATPIPPDSPAWEQYILGYVQLDDGVEAALLVETSRFYSGTFGPIHTRIVLRKPNPALYKPGATLFNLTVEQATDMAGRIMTYAAKRALDGEDMT